MKKQKGIALILVIFIITLATIIVVDLTQSTYLGSRRNAMVENAASAEYLLKSAVSLSQVIIQRNGLQCNKFQPWHLFAQGAPVPKSILDTGNENAVVELEIQPEESKFPARVVVQTSGSQVNIQWRDALTRLYNLLGFSSDADQTEPSGPMKGNYFDSPALVANLIDYIDTDNDNYNGQGSFSDGIDANLPKNFFPNSFPTEVSQMDIIPGYTDSRMRLLEALISVKGDGRVNINTASKEVLRSLTDDSVVSDPEIDQIVAEQNNPKSKGFQTGDGKLGQIIANQQGASTFSSMIKYECKWFQVIAKARIGTASYYARAFIVVENSNDLPEIKGMEIY